MSTQSKHTTVHTPSTDDSSPDKRFLSIRQALVNLPYPPPQIIAEYNQTEAGLGTKLIELIERENFHRHTCEKEALHADIASRQALANNERLAIWAEFLPRLLGQVFAFLLCTGFGALGGYLVYIGKGLPGAFIGSGGLIGLALIFIRGHSTNMPHLQKSRNQKQARPIKR